MVSDMRIAKSEEVKKLIEVGGPATEAIVRNNSVVMVFNGPAQSLKHILFIDTASNHQFEALPNLGSTLDAVLNGR